MRHRERRRSVSRVAGPGRSFSIGPGDGPVVRIYTKTGDDGTTGLYHGGRVRKDAAVMQLNGTVDEAQAAMGLGRAEVPGTELDTILTRLERELYVLMAEVATDPAKRSRLEPGRTLVTVDMVEALEADIDGLLGRFEMPADFVVPGATRASAALDLARTIVRRAERLAVAEPVDGSQVARYLNRLSDLLWATARWAEGDDHLLARTAPRGARGRTRETPAPSTSTGGPDDVPTDARHDPDDGAAP
jgi:cob(I)alamin adenosyltransferase